VLSLPDTIVEYQENTKIQVLSDYAEAMKWSGMRFLSTYLKVADKGSDAREIQDEDTKSATYFLIMQAIAEDSGMSVGLDELAAYFTETTGSADYSKYQESYGLPYLKLIALCQRVIDSMVENAVLE
jgi:trigger factor